jgi:hypothetical protein
MFFFATGAMETLMPAYHGALLRRLVGALPPMKYLYDGDAGVAIY